MLSLNLDLQILLAALSGFIFSLFAHVLALRSTPVSQTARVMLGCIIFGFLTNEALFFLLGLIHASGRNPSITSVALGSIFSAVIYGLLVFNYLGWIFGMGTSAIRIHLLQMLMRAPDRRATQEQILAQFNAQKILRNRLERLVGSGHLFLKDDGYAIRSKVLVVQVWITATFKDVLGIPREKTAPATAEKGFKNGI